MNEIPEDVEIETIWVVDVPYTPEAQERRPPLRRAHLTRIARLIREGRIVEAGGTADFTQGSSPDPRRDGSRGACPDRRGRLHEWRRVAFPGRAGVRARDPAQHGLGVDSGAFRHASLPESR